MGNAKSSAKLAKLFQLSLASLGLGLLTSPAFAFYGDEVAEQVICESHRGRIEYCDIDTGGRVVLVEQYSRSACIEGQTWGVNRRGLWVSEGCRASFGTVYERRGRRDRGNYGQPGNGYGGEVFRCESHEGRQAYCAIPGRGRVRLVNQLSRSECREGYSWGQDRRGVWVSNGCRAEFAIY